MHDSTNSQDSPVSVSEDFRTLAIPYNEQVLGCKGDAWVRRVYFNAPRYVDGTDISGYQFVVNYRNQNGEEDKHIVTDLSVDDDTLTFSWLVGATACAYAGKTEVSVTATDTDDDTDEVLHRFSSTTYAWSVLPSTIASDSVVTEYSDAVEALITEWQADVSDAVSAIAYKTENIASHEPRTSTYLQQVTDATGTSATIESIKGNTVVWNQLVHDPNFDGNAPSGYNWAAYKPSNVSAVVSGNKITATMLSSGSGYNYGVSCNVDESSVVVGHKYLIAFTVTPSESASFGIDIFNSSSGQYQTVSAMASTKTRAGFIFEMQSASPARRAIIKPTTALSIDSTYSIEKAVIFDLTLMFGAGNEPSTVAEFDAMYPLSFYAYNAPLLLAANPRGVLSETADSETLAELEIPVETYFPNGMKSAGNVRDELIADKAVTRVGRVDLGTVTWGSSNPENHIFRCNSALNFTDIKKPSSASAIANAVCSDYTITDYQSISSSDDRCFAISNGDVTVFIDHRYSTLESFAAAMSGVYLYYELATPTETPIDPPLTLTYRVDDGGTESIILDTTQPAPQSAPPVMTTAYAYSAEGLRDAALSTIAPVENGATASDNYAVGSYLMHGGTLYRVTSAIASGESINPGTNCTAVTVMAELVRLTS